MRSVTETIEHVKGTAVSHGNGQFCTMCSKRSEHFGEFELSFVLRGLGIGTNTATALRICEACIDKAKTAITKAAAGLQNWMWPKGESEDDGA